MRRDILTGIICSALGLALGYFIGQEVLKYQIRNEVSKGLQNVSKALGVVLPKSRDEKSNKNESGEPKETKEAIVKEVPFDPSRMSNEGYLQAKWGMTLQEVVDVTGANVLSDGKRAVIETEIADENAAALFLFVNNKLYKTALIIRKETTNNENYLPVYDKIESLLIEKYGKPKKKKKIGSGNPYIADGMAIVSGQGHYFTVWESPETNITLDLHGDNFKIKFAVHYESKKYTPLAQAERKRKAKDNL